MFAMPVPVQEILERFTPVLSRPVWNHAQILILGAILARGKRAVTATLRAMGLTRERLFTNYHRGLDRAVWHAWFASKILFGLLRALLPKEAPLLLLVDETIERRKDDKNKTKLYDPPPEPVPGKRGGKPLKGERQPSLKERLTDPATVWEKR